MTNGGSASMAKVVLLDAWSNSLLGLRADVHRHGEGDGEGDDLGEDDQLEVDGERLGDDARRRLVRRERLAQVALEHVADPDEVLLPQRLVEAELAVERWPRSAGWRWARGSCRWGCPGGGGPGRRSRSDTKMMMMMSSTNRFDDVTGHGAPFPPSPVSVPSLRAGLLRRRMILDLRPIVLPCAPCQRRFPLSPAARASSPAWAWGWSSPPGCSSASGPARACGSTRP